MRSGTWLRVTNWASTATSASPLISSNLRRPFDNWVVTGYCSMRFLLPDDCLQKIALLQLQNFPSRNEAASRYGTLGVILDFYVNCLVRGVVKLVGLSKAPIPWP